MTLGRLRLLTLLLICFAALAADRPAAQSEFTDRELTISPYFLPVGKLDAEKVILRHERLAQIAETAGDHARAARHYVMACQDRTNLAGDATLSHPSCHRARELAQQHGVTDVAVALKTIEGTVRGWQFDFQGSSTVLRQAIADGAGLNPDVPDSAPLTGAHQMLGAVLIERGEFDEAERSLSFGRDHCRISGNSGCVVYTEMFLCRLHTMLGDYGAARTACDTSRAVAGIDNDQMSLANLGWMQGTLELAVGRPAAALPVLQDAWRASHAPGGGPLQPILAQLITDALIRLGRLDEAERWQHDTEQALKEKRIPFWYGPQIAMRRGELARALDKPDESRPAFTMASRSLIHEMSIRGHIAAALASKQLNDLPAARESLEHAITKIEASRTNVSGASLRAAYLTLHSRAYSELVGIRWDADGAAAAADALRIAEKGRARALVDALASAQVVGASAPTLDAAAVQATLGANEVLVEYVSLESRLFALTVTRDRIAFTALPDAGSAAALAKRIDFFSALVQESDEASLAPAARRLYESVLAPALANVPSTARTLIIAADGPLHRLPFDALGAPPLIDRWDVVTLPSASALANRVRRTTPTAPALVVAAPITQPGLDALPAAQDEAAAIHRRLGGDIAELSGAGATRAGLDELKPSRFAVLHFASHAIVDEERPLRSALILSPTGTGVDGRWTAEEIYRANLAADLVVLSACSTAAGAQTPGEGVMSLARAFLYAGAQATIATLWNVPDAPGPVFADVLYRQLAAGRPLGEAAADARRELRKRGAPPRAWAAYVLTGNPRTQVSVKGPGDRRLMTAGIGGVSAALLIAAASIFLGRLRSRIRWQAPALAGIVLAIVAVVSQPWTWREPRLDAGDHASRGDVRVALAPAIYQGQLTWSAVPGADEHLVQAYDGTGVPIGEPIAATSPFALPTTAGGWVRVEARDHSQLLTRSTLIQLQ